MEATRIDGWTRRRFGAAGGGLLASLLALAAGDGEARKKKRRKPKHKPKSRPKPKKGDFCTPTGELCHRQGKKCAAKFCLKAPFTIEARWAVDSDYDTYLFVPPKDETTGPAPFINYGCEVSDNCNTQYPFACTSGDETDAGSEIITVYQLLEGTYEHWMELYYDDAPGLMTVELRNADGRVVRRWESPVSPTSAQDAWHVFDIDGATGAITSIDTLIEESLPAGAHDPYTNVCP